MRPLLFPAFGLLLLSSVLSTGCTTTKYTAFAQSMRPVEQTTVSAQARNKVYAFFMNGADVLELNGFAELQDGLICAGYPKLYYAQRSDREWFRKELHHLHRDDPDARFILVGYGSAADQIQTLACQVSHEDIPLDAVVYIDPICAKGDLTQNVPYRAVILKSHHWRGAPHLKAPETVTIDRVGHIGVPHHPATVQYFVDLLTESARMVPIADPTIVCRPVLNEKRAIPRPAEPQEIKPPPPGWEFLCPNGR